MVQSPFIHVRIWRNTLDLNDREKRRKGGEGEKKSEREKKKGVEKGGYLGMYLL